MPWYLYLALKQVFPTGRRVSFFACVSIVGVMLGVAVLIGVLSVMNGFQKQIREKIVDTGGHVTIVSNDLIRETGELVAFAEGYPEVVTAQAQAEGIVMMQHRNVPKFPALLSVDVSRAEQVIPVNEYLRSGELADLDDEGIFLSSILARELRAFVGDTVEVYTPLQVTRARYDEVLLPRELEVVGVFETGYAEVDQNLGIVTYRLMRDLYGLEGEAGEPLAHRILVRLKDRDEAIRVATRMEEELGEPYRVLSWLELNENFFFVLALEKTILTIIILFIILVASFSIASSLLTTVVRKTREIGLIGALGGLPRENALVYTIQGLIIGVTGTALGALLAVGVLYFRDPIVLGIARVFGQEDFLLRFYQFSRLPVDYKASDFVTVVIAAVIISTLAGLVPAWRAARLRPSEALRNE